ncbi:hypothetical protein O181_120220 [Austropuccinia psidii MF-1]|uniref:Uncharacterized protein n=1 Tax=Austropuccinia psidii MF-1 TaxID=1389203 RepID=A0A9Q3Q143_9BASI|nr:hypothetical protein [Austropuccinia psidii MF-1]
MTTAACDACRQAHKKCLFFVCPFRPRSQRSSRPRRPCKDSFVVNDDETIFKHEWTPRPQAVQQERFRTISLVPPSIDLSTHNPMVTSLLNRSEVIIRPMKDEQNPPNPPQQDSPVPSLPRKQTPRKPTPGPSGTRWSEELFHEPSKNEEPPIAGPSPSSQPPEDVPTCEPEPEVAPTQSTEEPFGKSPLLFLHPYQLFLTFSLTISSLSHHSLLDNYH